MHAPTDRRAAGREFLAGGGEIGALMRARDWSTSKLGPVDAWPQSLRTAISILLGSPEALQLFWGPDLVLLYNDATRPMMGQRHETCFGEPALQIWPEVKEYLGGLLHAVMATGVATSTKHGLMVTERNGYKEEQYFSWSYSPIRVEDGSVGGVFQVAQETTDEVIAERRQRVLHELAVLPPAATADAACIGAAEHLRATDIPFALIYLLDAPANRARLVAVSGIGAGSSQSPTSIDLGAAPSPTTWPLAEAFRIRAPVDVPDLAARFGPQVAHGWVVAPHTAKVLPLLGPDPNAPHGFLVVGLGAGRALDASYLEFLSAVATQMGTTLTQLGAAAVAHDNARMLTQTVLARQRLESLAEELSLADRRKDEFLAMLGHELRNPLAPIATAVELMKLRNGTQNQVELAVIERQVGHLSRLVGDLLDVARIAQGKIDLERHVVDVAQIVDTALEMASPLVEARRHQVKVDVPRTGLAVDADVGRLAQVVANLLTNAAKFTPPGGHLAVTARGEGAEAVLTVEDDGVGIDPELLPRVFDLFVQNARALNRAEGGLGLGLALARNLVALHEGTIAAQSEGVGRGARFTVRLPLATRPASLRTPVAMRAPSAAKRILIVDDNEDSADLLANLLRGEGHEVAVAYDGAQAVKVLAGFAAEIGVLDIGLPVMDGYELAGAIRALPVGRDCRLIAVTGYGQSRDRKRGGEAGFDAFFTKPLAIEKLLAEIARQEPAKRA